MRPTEARRVEPGIAPTLRAALDVPGDHAIDPRRLVAALDVAVRRAGVTVRERAPVHAVAVSGERVTGVTLDGGEHVAADQVVMAAGCWSAGIEGIPPAARMPVRPVKGQILRLHDPAGPGLATRVLRGELGYLVPRGDGRYVIGGTVEERGHDLTSTAGATERLLRDTMELVPGVSELVIDELGAGLRPGTPDNGPILGHGALDGLVWATGHYRNGILLAPITGEIVSALLAGAQSPHSGLAASFAPGRFASVAAGTVGG